MAPLDKDMAYKDGANQDMRAAIAVTRFGLGAKPGEIAQARSDPRGFLKAQIRRSGADQPVGQAQTTAQRMAEFRDYRRERREVRVEKAADVRPPGPSSGRRGRGRPQYGGRGRGRRREQGPRTPRPR